MWQYHISSDNGIGFYPNFKDKILRSNDYTQEKNVYKAELGVS
jgi:hypothetical protein